MENYKLLLSEISKILKGYGYKKSGDTFLKVMDNNFGLINFQKSRKSTSIMTLFTINLGVYSNSLKLLDARDVKSKPEISDCHWRKRIGTLSDTKQEHWWQVDNNTSLSTIITEIEVLLKEVAIPEIEHNISDESLEKSWMAGVSSGLTESQMYLYLIAMLKAYGKDSVEAKVTELKDLSRGKPFSNNVNEHLKKLGIE